MWAHGGCYKDTVPRRATIAAGLGGPALAVLMACATSAVVTPGAAEREQPAVEEVRLHPAGESLPAPGELAEGAERRDLELARGELAHAERASASGDPEHAQAVARAAGEALRKLDLDYPASGFRLVYRRAAALAFLEAGEMDAAAGEAERLRDDPDADAGARAGAARVACGALRKLAEREVKAGLIAPAEVLRKTELRPRAPVGTWKRLVEAVDAYARLEADDPAAGAAREAASLELLAAQVTYAHDEVEEAQSRLEELFRRFPVTSAAVEGVGPYLQTFAARRDMAGYAAAVERLKAELEAARPRAVELSEAAGSLPEEKSLPAHIDSVLAQLAGERDRMEFAAAMELLRGGKPAEAAAAFERYAESHPDARDAAAALHNAGVAYGRARQPRKAQATLLRLISRYPDATEVGAATLALATLRLEAGDGPGAAQLYQRYLRRFPDGDERCLALVNLGAAQEQADRPLDAATRYLAFGRDPRCADEDPNTAAHALSTAGHLYLEAGRRDEARTAFRQLLQLRGALESRGRGAAGRGAARARDPAVTRGQEGPVERRLGALAREVEACRRCPRLVAWREEVAQRKRRAYRDEAYFGRGVPGFGDPGGWLLLVGLAPGAHGANRTGRMFTGDGSGDFLYAALHRASLASQARSERRDDGLTLRGCFITAAARCVPPLNRPSEDELLRCAPFLDRELEALRPRVVLALGAIAFRAALGAFARAGVLLPRPRPRFAHAVVVALPRAPLLIGSYHVSRQNTQTGRLTAAMFDAVLEQAKALGGDAAAGRGA